MSPIQSNNTLQNVLLLDAATCIAAGALMAFGSNFVAGLTAIPAPLLYWAAAEPRAERMVEGASAVMVR